MTARRRFSRWKLSRDGILFVAGLSGIAYETLSNGGDRPTLLVLFGGMVGLPALLRQDERKSLLPPPQSRPDPETETEPESEDQRQ